MDAILTIYGRGQVTLPKKMRDAFPTRHFLARMTRHGILIEPMYARPLEDSDDAGTSYSETDRDVRLRFDPPRKMDEALKNLKKAHASLRKVSR